MPVNEAIVTQPMVIPSIGSTAVFVSIIGFVVASLIAGERVGAHRIASNGESIAGRRPGFALVVNAWLAIGALLPIAGILAADVLPPPPLIYVAICFAGALLAASGQTGRRLASLPVGALIAFHGFRLPLELVLHNWYKSGTLPIQMTYEGYNFDIATGIVAVAIGVWAIWTKVPIAAAWVFNLVGSALLLNVIVIAITSSPLSVRQFMNDPPVQLILYFPYSWIVSIAVTGALLGHLVLTRKLLSSNMRTTHS